MSDIFGFDEEDPFEVPVEKVVKAPEKIKTALIDGDLLIYAICAAAEYGNDPEDVDIESIYHAIEVRVNNVMLDAGCNRRQVFLTDSNFRHFIIGNYKANRDDVWRPSCLGKARDYARLFLAAKSIAGLEADDLMAMYQTEDTVICTIDKDLLQVDGNHYQWPHSGKDGKLLKVTNGYQKFYYQMLIGDTTDNIIGCGKKTVAVYKSGAKMGQTYSKRVGVGPKAAEKVLSDCYSEEDCLAAIEEEYEKVFGSNYEEILVQQARLIYMVREYKDGLAKMWSLPESEAWLNPETGEWRMNG